MSQEYSLGNYKHNCRNLLKWCPKVCNKMLKKPLVLIFSQNKFLLNLYYKIESLQIYFKIVLLFKTYFPVQG